MGYMNGGVLDHQNDGIDDTSPFAHGFGGFVNPNEATYMELCIETDPGKQSSEVAEKSKLTSACVSQTGKPCVDFDLSFVGSSVILV